MSVNSTDPGTLFGGTWEQIKDVFLLSAGDTYTEGEKGGEAEHTLTTKEMPKHAHNVIPYSGSSGSVNPSILMNLSNGVYSLGTGSAGGDQPHNNMPPYLTVYMWKRTG